MAEQEKEKHLLSKPADLSLILGTQVGSKGELLRVVTVHAVWHACVCIHTQNKIKKSFSVVNNVRRPSKCLGLELQIKTFNKYLHKGILKKENKYFTIQLMASAKNKN